MIDHIIFCTNYEQHIIKLPKPHDDDEPPEPCIYISTELTASSYGWKREGFKWYCPECVKENIEDNYGLIESDPNRQI